MKTETVPNEIERQERLKIKTTSVNYGRTFKWPKSSSQRKSDRRQKKIFRKAESKIFLNLMKTINS